MIEKESVLVCGQDVKLEFYLGSDDEDNSSEPVILRATSG